MTAEHAGAIDAFGHTFDAGAIVLLAMLAAFFYTAWRAQKREDFDWGEAFRDDSGKVSFLRVGIIVMIGVSSWVLIYLTMNAVSRSSSADQLRTALEGLFPFFSVFMIVLASAKSVDRVLDAIMVRFGLKPPPAQGQ